MMGQNDEHANGGRVMYSIAMSRILQVICADGAVRVATRPVTKAVESAEPGTADRV